jgi:hypothetical protein
MAAPFGQVASCSQSDGGSCFPGPAHWARPPWSRSRSRPRPWRWPGWRFRRTDWYVWQRTKPSTHDGAPGGQLVAIGVLVGMLGGLIGPIDEGLDVRISVADR